MEVKNDKKKSQCTFHFLDAQKVREAGDAFDRMPEFSNLQTDGWLVQLPIDIRKAHWGFYRNDVLTVSHSWESKPHPDTMGVQLQSILKYVRSDVGFTCDVVALLCQAAPQNDSPTVSVTCGSSSCDSMMLPLKKETTLSSDTSLDRASVLRVPRALTVLVFRLTCATTKHTQGTTGRRKASTNNAARDCDGSSQSCPTCGINTLSARARVKILKFLLGFLCLLERQWKLGGRCTRLAVQVPVGGLPVHVARLANAISEDDVSLDVAERERALPRWVGPHPHGQRLPVQVLDAVRGLVGDAAMHKAGATTCSEPVPLGDSSILPRL